LCPVRLQAAAVYEHAVQSEEARKADLLPVVGKIRGKRGD
jgi:hypothetical protein